QRLVERQREPVEPPRFDQRDEPAARERRGRRSVGEGDGGGRRGADDRAVGGIRQRDREHFVGVEVQVRVHQHVERRGRLARRERDRAGGAHVVGPGGGGDVGRREADGYATVEVARATEGEAHRPCRFGDGIGGR